MLVKPIQRRAIKGGQNARNADDGVMDPEVIAAQSRLGFSSFFEVELALAEFRDVTVNSSASGGLVGSPQFIGAGGLGDIPPFGHCPELSQYVWVEKNDHRPYPIKVTTLVQWFNDQKEIKLFNPLTRNFNKVTNAEIIKEQPLFKTRTELGAENLTSQSHKIIVNTSQLSGIPLIHYGAGRECLSFDKADGQWNIFSDTLIEIADAGTGDVVNISLDKEFIYASGMTKTQGICCHNVKIFLELPQ